MARTFAHRPEWHTSAACRGIPNPDIFFPENNDPNCRVAKELCQTCPVIRECLRDALARDEQFGIWGGLPRRGRVALAKKHKAKTGRSTRAA